MAKRFTCTDKWKKPFIRGLQGTYKLLWFYILDDCDTAGIWQLDFEVASIRIGETITEKIAKEVFKDKIIILDDGQKWFIPSFIDFQYGKLQENNRAHTKAILSLRKYNLLDEHLEIKPLTSPLQGAMVVVEVEDKDKVKEKPEFLKFIEWIKKEAPNVMKMKEPFTEPQFTKLFNDYPNKPMVMDIILAMHNKVDLLKKYSSANLTCRSWIALRNKGENNTLPEQDKEAIRQRQIELARKNA